MLRVLLATGDVELDGAIASALTGKGAEVAGECRTREDAAGAAAERGADVVVLSPRLPGRIGMVELVRSLRAAGLRMVLLAGARADVTAQSLAREAISLGVYDVVWDPIVIDQVVQRILTPAAPAEAGVVRGEGITGSGGVAGEGGQKVPIWRRLFRRGKLTGHAKESGRPVASPSAGAPDGPPARTGGDPRGGEAAASAAAGEAPAWEASFRRLEPTGEEREGTPGDGSPRDAAEAGGKRVPPVPRAHGGRVWAGEPEPRVGSRGSPAGALVLAGRDVAALLREAGIKIVSDPLDAKVCVCDPARAMLAPRGMPLLVVRSGSVSDLAAAMSRPDASLVDRAGLAEAVRRALAEEMPGNPEGGRIGIPAPGLGEVLRDPLTGCYTRRCLEVLDLDPPCAVVFIDLDGFKEVNDTLGHDAGDGVLAAFGAVLRESLKGKDVPIRWGGDEFVLLLPGTAGADAERVVDGLRRAWRERAPDTGDLEVGFSAGVAEWRGGPLEAAVKEADRLMYAEKRTRKEREAARTGAPEGRRAPRREGRPNVYVLPGRKVEGGVAVPEHGAIYVACPGEPPAAGRIAAALARQVPGSALVCASGTSTAALALGMRPEDLVLSDWRVPGSDAPVSFGGVVVWPVDPGKFLGARDVPPHALVSQIRHRFPLVVVDCGGDLSLCAGAPRDAAVVVARTGGEASDWVVERWLRDYGGNALVVRAGEEIALEGVGGGFLLRAGEAAARDRHPRKL